MTGASRSKPIFCYSTTNERAMRSMTEERDILKKATAYLTFGHFVPPGMQSETSSLDFNCGE